MVTLQLTLTLTHPHASANVCVRTRTCLDCARDCICARGPLLCALQGHMHGYV